MAFGDVQARCCSGGFALPATTADLIEQIPASAWQVADDANVERPG